MALTKDEKIGIIGVLLITAGGITTFIYNRKQKAKKKLSADGSIFGSIVDSFEGLPSLADQISYINTYLTRVYTSGAQLNAANTLKNTLPYMAESDVRTIYKYYHDYFNPYGGHNDKIIPDETTSDYEDVLNNNNIPNIL